MAKTTKRTTAKATLTTNPTTAKRTGVTKTRAAVEPTEEQIRMRAFEVFQRRNGAPGTPDGDWFIAQQELRQELTGK